MGGLSWTEILVILVFALILFGPRKLPELGKSLGQAIGQFKRASEDFKRSWEDEVDLEKERDRNRSAAQQAKQTSVEATSVTAETVPSTEQNQAEHWL